MTDQNTTPVRILRLTRHASEAAQAASLARIFGADAVVEDTAEQLPSDAKGAVARFDELTVEYDVVEAVLPIGLMEAIKRFSAFSKRGGRLIRAIMKRVPRTNPDGTPFMKNLPNGTQEQEVDYHFEAYEEVVKIEVVTTKL